MFKSRPIDSEDIPTNGSDNEHFQTVVQRAWSRRGFLKTGAGLSAAIFLAGPLAACSSGSDSNDPAPAEPLLGFGAIPIATTDTVSIAAGYTATPFASWGTPLFADAGAWKTDASDDAAAQAKQVGDNHDGIHFFPLNNSSEEGLLVMNHEYTTVGDDGYTWLFGPKGTEPWTAAKAAKAMNAHGVSVMHIVRKSGKWEIDTSSSYNRRITASTEMMITGPAAGDALLKTKAEPTGTRVLGTFNNCGNGWTPWNTYLTCEENFNNYFGTLSGTDTRSDVQKRYGLSSGATGYRWEEFSERFDYAREPNESNRFGWIVEIDPFDPAALPRKRTALGRIKHENAACTLAQDSRVVIYMGDDQANEYIYKFVSESAYRSDGYNPDLLDTGKLYVARFTDGETAGDLMGKGEWLLLDKDANPALKADTRFASQAEVLINTRLAADTVGATKMDRPEWISTHPDSGEVYVTLTNNSGRKEPNAANPRPANLYGQIIRWREDGGDAAALSFEWDLFVLAGNPLKYSDRSDLKSGTDNITAENMFNSPDGLAFDTSGRLWIQTDGKYSNSGEYEGQGNNQMLCADPVSKEIRRFLVGPKECEVTGITFTPDSKTMFINIQHPGEDGDSHWPDGGSSIPRSSTLVITKDDDGVIGT